MRVEYEIEALPDLEEIQLAGVPLERATACPVCDSSDLLEIAQLHDSLATACCNRCGHLFHQTRPSASWYSKWYQGNWDGAKEHQQQEPARVLPGARTLTMIRQRLGRAARALVPTSDLLPGRELFEFCRPAIMPGDRLLDIGCGYGGHLLPFIEYGCSAFGIEASPHRAKQAARLGARTVNIPVEDLRVATFSTRFQLVVSNHVFEHVNDPHAFLTAVSGVLEPGGWLSLTVPNQDTDFLLQQFFFALHIHCFSASSLVEALRRHGFVTHRLLQEHQLRILAQYQPEQARREVLRPFGRPAIGDLTEAIARSTLGDDYQQRAGREYYCRWKNHERATHRHYDVRYSVEKPEARDRTIRLAWSGERQLPIVFQKATAPQQPVPFWAK